MQPRISAVALFGALIGARLEHHKVGTKGDDKRVVGF